MARVKGNGTGIENKHFKMKQFWEAMMDPKTWLLFLFALMSNSPNGGLSAVSAFVQVEGILLMGFTVPRSYYQGCWV